MRKNRARRLHSRYKTGLIRSPFFWIKLPGKKARSLVYMLECDEVLIAVDIYRYSFEMYNNR